MAASNRPNPQSDEYDLLVGFYATETGKSYQFHIQTFRRWRLKSGRVMGSITSLHCHHHDWIRFKCHPLAVGLPNINFLVVRIRLKGNGIWMRLKDNKQTHICRKKMPRWLIINYQSIENWSHPNWIQQLRICGRATWISQLEPSD